jgi:adenylate cyclase
VAADAFGDEALYQLPLVAPVQATSVGGQRTVFADVDSVGYETQLLAVGFVDLVGFTSLGEQLSLRDLGGVLTRFEQLATDTGYRQRRPGRQTHRRRDLVHNTGRHVRVHARARFVTGVPGPRAPSICASRRGHGSVLRDGDVFGPVVNLATRLVKAAEPGEVVATQMSRMRLDSGPKPAAASGLKGGTGDVELRRLIRR